MEFQLSDNLQLSPIFLDCTYELLLFRFYVKLFQIMGTRCSLVFVTFIFCPLHYDIVKILMECRNSHNLQLGLFFFLLARMSYFSFGFTLNFFKLWEPAVVYFLSPSYYFHCSRIS